MRLNNIIHILIILALCTQAFGQQINNAVAAHCGQVNVTYSGPAGAPYTMTAGYGQKLVDAAKSAAYIAVPANGTYTLTLNGSSPFPAATPPCRVDPNMWMGGFQQAPVGNVSSYGGSSAVMFDAPVATRVVLDGALVTLPSMQSPAGIALGPNRELHLWYGTANGPVMDRYSATGALLASYPVAGSQYMQVRQPAVLADGTIVAPFFVVPSGSTQFSFYLGLLWLKNGVAQVQYPIILPGVAFGTQMAVAQHPTSGDVWVFWKNDSAENIGALVLNAQTRSVLQTLPSLIYFDHLDCNYVTGTNKISDCAGAGGDGEFGPEGEYPTLHAVADSTAIILAYQRMKVQYLESPTYSGDVRWDGVYPVKTARLGFARIDAGGGKTFFDGPGWVNVFDEFGLVVRNGALEITYGPMQSDLSWNTIFHASYVGAAWTPPVSLGPRTGYNRPPSILNGQAYLAMPDGLVHQVALPDIPAPPPPPPCSPRGKSGKCR